MRALFRVLQAAHVGLQNLLRIPSYDSTPYRRSPSPHLSPQTVCTPARFFCSFGFRFVHIIQGSRPCHHSCVRALPAGVKLCANTRSQRHAPVMLAGARHRYVATARHSVHDDCQRACGRSASRRPQGEAAREVAGNERAVVGRWHVMAMTWPTHHGDLTSSWARAGESNRRGRVARAPRRGEL